MKTETTTTNQPRWDDVRGIWVGPEKTEATPKQSAMDRLREKRKSSRSDAMVLRHAQAGKTSYRQK